MSYSGLSKQLLHLVGDRENIAALVHCATRLRFTLHDNSKARANDIKALDGVLTAVESGGQFQVVIGSHVSHVYAELMKLIGGGVSVSTDSDTKKKAPLGARIFEVVSGSFSPLIGAMAGTGMIKALLVVLTMVGWLDATSSSYLILAAAANSVFYFLPILLGISVAIKLGANAYIGGAIGAALLEPNFTGLIGNNSANFFGIPVVAINYSSTVFPVFIAVATLALLERYLKRVCPNNIQLFMVPMLSLLILVPLTVLMFGPFGVYVGDLIAAGINWLNAHSGVLTGAVIGGSMMFLVVLGLHWGLVPIIIANLSSGGDPIAAMWAPATFAQMGVALAFFLRSKDMNIKALAGPATVTGLLAGVTEPIIYGLIMRFRKTIPIVIVAGAIGGALNGFFHAKVTAFAFHSLLSIPVFTPVIAYSIGIVTSFGLAFLCTMMLNVEKKTKTAINANVEVAN